jgi:hypothetical protein
VDADDGVLDGSGVAGDNFFNTASTGIKFVFNAQVLGHLPTHVGVVYTDSNNPVFYEAFDSTNTSLGVRGPFNFPVTSHNGEAINDFFFQIYNPAGVSSIRVWGTGGGGIEVDHLQYGYDAVVTGNAPPVVSAGPPQTVTLPPGVVTLNGAVSDDGLPAGGVLRSVWTKVSGGGTVTFSNPYDLHSEAAFTTSGEYQLRLTATDGEFSSSSDLTVTVNPPGTPTPTPTPTPQNAPPTANAGEDRSVSLNSNLVLNPSAEADLVNGEVPYWTGVQGAAWTRVEGGVNDVPAARFGTHAFAASDDAVVEMKQDVDLRGFEGRIASGTQEFTLQVYVRSLAENTPDAGQILIEYRDASNQNVIATLNSGQIASTNDWHLTEDVRVPPPGTGFVRIRLIATRNSGDTNDVFFDGINLKPTGNIASLKLSGTASDDGLPSGSSLTTTWTKVSGSGTVTFANALTPDSAVTFDAPGTYVLRLTATDGDLSATDEVVVTVGPGNSAPIVNAGVDQTVNLPANGTLAGAATDENGTAPRVRWEKVSGPGVVSFANPSSLATAVSFGAAGSYVVRLTAEDGELESSDEVSFTVNAAPVNQPPTVDAGSNQTIQLPVNSATLNGAANDDGLPNGNFSKVWTKRIGPGNVVFASPNTPQTGVTFDAAGTYVLRLSVSDGQYSAFDETVVTVNPVNGGEGNQNQPPVINAGADQTITVSQTAIFEAISIVDDGLPNGANYTSQWSKVSGDGNVTFSHPTETATYATFSQTGTYVVRLSVSDSQLTGTDDITVIVVDSQPGPVVDILTPDDGAKCYRSDDDHRHGVGRRLETRAQSRRHKRSESTRVDAVLQWLGCDIG